MTKEEWDALRGLGDDGSIVIKKADNCSCVVVWCTNDYIKEAENQLRDNTVYKDVNFKETMLSDLVEKKAISFLKVCTVGKALRRKNSNTSPINLKRQPTSANYMFCHKRLSNVPGRPVISNCGTPTEKASEFLDFYLKPLMQNGWSYLRDSGDFIDKIKRIEKITEGPFLVTVDVVGLYPSIPHKEGIVAIKQKLEEQSSIKIPTNEMFNYMDKTETDFLKTQYNHLFGCAISRKSFLYGHMKKQNLKNLWRNWTNFYLTF